MSERLTLVLPDGTKEKLKNIADEQKRKVCNLGMRYILEGIVRDIVKRDIK